MADDKSKPNLLNRVRRTLREKPEVQRDPTLEANQRARAPREGQRQVSAAQTLRDRQRREQRQLPKNETELTYDEMLEYMRRRPSGSRGVELPSREEFQQLARSETADRWRERAYRHNERALEQEGERYRLEAKGQAADVKQQLNEEWQNRITDFQDSLREIGQGNELTSDRYRNLAEMSMALLSVEGDTDEAVAARQTAAEVFYRQLDQLAPHLRAIDPNWYEQNVGRIQAELNEMEPGFGSKLLEATLSSSPVQYVFDLLTQTEQGAAHALRGVTSALDTDDEVSAGDALKYAFSSFGQGILGLGEHLTTPGVPARGDVGIQPGRALTTSDGRVLLPAQDEDMNLNLREALALDPDAGGFAADVFDTIGLAAIDPLSWVSMSQSNKVRAALRGVERYGDDTAQMAAQRLRSGARMDDLTMVERDSFRSALLRNTAESVELWSDPKVRRALLRRGLRNPFDNPREIATNLRREADSVERARDLVIRQRTDALEQAVRRGSMPGLRVGGTTVIPMPRVYEGLGLINRALSRESAWARQVLQLAEIEDTNELLHFMQTFQPGTEVPEEIKDQVRKWALVTDTMSEDPRTWLNDILQRSENPQDTFEQIEAFGRVMLDDRRVDDWRLWYDNEFGLEMVDPGAGRVRAPEVREIQRNLDEWGNLERGLEDWPADVQRMRKGKEPLGPERGGARARDAQNRRINEEFQAQMSLETERQLALAGEGRSLVRAYEAVDLDELSDAARAKLRFNEEVFQNPYRWVQTDFNVGGIRSLANRDNILGRLLRRTSDALSPRAAIRRTATLGSDVADRVAEAEALATATRDLYNDHLNRLGVNPRGRSRLARAAQAEVDGDVWEQATRFLTENEDNVPAIVDQLRANNMPNMANFVDSLQAVRQDIFDLSVASGADQAALLARKGYMPRVQTREVRQAADQALREGDTRLVEAFQRLGVIDSDGRQLAGEASPLGQQGHLLGRTFEPDVEDLFEVNRRAQEQLEEAGLVVDGQLRLYEDNPLRAMLLRSRVAHEAHIYHDMLTRMSELTDLAGRPLAYVAKDQADNANIAVRMASDSATFGKGDYVKHTLPNGGEVWVERTINSHIESTRRIMGQPEFPSKFRSLMEGHNNIWGAWATVPLVNMAFHARNATGNMFNMLLAGFTSPGALGEAFNAQRAYQRIRRVMKSDGLGFTDAARQLGIDDRQLRLIDAARTHNILGTGQTADIFEGFDPLKGTTTLSPFDQNNIVLRSGRNVGTAIENNARMALFIDGINKGMSPADAGNRVRQYLFDYEDLTQFEAQNLRMVSRFYTFTRKNTALQTRLLLTQPGAIANANRVSQEFQDLVVGGLTGDYSGEDVEGGIDEEGRRIPDYAQNVLRLYGRGTLAGVDTPLNAAVETYAALDAVLKTPFHIINLALADDRSSRYEEGARMSDNIRQMLGLVSGGPVEGVRTLFEQATRVDTFSGANLANVDRTPVDVITRWTDAFMPVFGKIDRELEYYGAYEALGIMQDETSPDRVQGATRLMNALLGFTVVDGLDDPEQIDRNMQMLQREFYLALDQARDAAEAAGVDVPTMRELEEAGKVEMRNRAIDFLMYRTLDGEPLTPEEEAVLDRMVPKAVWEAYGREMPDAERSEMTEDDRVRRIEEMIVALERSGVDLPEGYKEDLILRMSGMSRGETMELGIEPSFGTNPYAERREGETSFQQQQRELATAEENLDRLARRFGISVEELRERHPVLQRTDRMRQQMREAGYSDARIRSELLENISREKQAMLLGEQSLEQEFSYRPLTAEEVHEYTQKFRREESEMIVLWQEVYGRNPSQEEYAEWMSEVMFTAPEQRNLGFENYTAPRRENTTTDEVYAERLRQKLAAIGAGGGAGEDFVTAIGDQP